MARELTNREEGSLPIVSFVLIVGFFPITFARLVSFRK